jgi:hypothetical protein
MRSWRDSTSSGGRDVLSRMCDRRGKAQEGTLTLRSRYVIAEQDALCWELLLSLSMAASAVLTTNARLHYVRWLGVGLVLSMLDVVCLSKPGAELTHLCQALVC